MKQKGRAAGGRKKKAKAPFKKGTPEQEQGAPAEADPAAEGTTSPATSPAIHGGRTGDPFEEEEREAVDTFLRLMHAFAHAMHVTDCWPHYTMDLASALA